MSSNLTSGKSGKPTIADVIAQYKAGNDPKGYRLLIDVVIKNEFNVKLPNDSYYDALVLTERMFKQTRQEIKIVTGCGCGGFYSTLLGPLTGALQRIQNTGGKAQMIVCAYQYPQWLGALAQEFSGTFQIALGDPKQLLQHFIVCDSKIVRLENIHPELKRDSSADEIKAEVNFNNPSKGQELQAAFEELWSKASINHPEASQKHTVPSWLIQRMEALQELPPPTFEDVETSFRAAEAARQTIYPNQKN